MQIFFSSEVEKYFKKTKRKDKKLANLIENKLALFVENPKHPSLRRHKLTGSMENEWSISINMGIRMVYVVVNEEDALFVKIGTHDEVYGKGN